MTEGKYRLRQVTEREEIQLNHSMNFVEWGKGLTQKEYLQREVHLGSQTSCRDGNLRFWSFEELDTSTGNWKVVSCLETLTRPAFYKIKGQPVQETVSHSLGAVFTPMEHRGKGHAKNMMDAVVKEFEKQDTWPQYKGLSKEALEHSFSALWSDIGLYYSKFGYQLSSIEELVLTVEEAHPVDKDVQWITKDQIPAISQEDEKQLVGKMNADTEADGVVRLAIRPTEYAHELTHARAHYLAPLMRPDHTVQNGEEVTRFGAVCNGVWILWTQDFAGDKLNILRMHCNETLDSKSFLVALDKLFAAAVTEAQAWGLHKVTLWKQDVPRLVDSKQLSLSSIAEACNSMDSPYKVKVQERDGSWPMWRFWKGATEDPSTGAKVEWVMDGKYAWF